MKCCKWKIIPVWSPQKESYGWQMKMRALWFWGQKGAQKRDVNRNIKNTFLTLLRSGTPLLIGQLDISFTHHG